MFSEGDGGVAVRAGLPQLPQRLYQSLLAGDLNAVLGEKEAQHVPATGFGQSEQTGNR